MLKMSLQVFFLVVVPLMTLIWFLNSGSTTTLIYGAGSAERELQLQAKRNGDTEIRLNDTLLLSKNFLDLEFDSREVFKTETFDYTLDCIKKRVSSKLQELACEFDSKRGEVFLLRVTREGFVRVSVEIKPS